MNVTPQRHNQPVRYRSFPALFFDDAGARAGVDHDESDTHLELNAAETVAERHLLEDRASGAGMANHPYDDGGYGVQALTTRHPESEWA